MQWRYNSLVIIPHSTSYSITFIASTSTGIHSKKYVYNSAQVIYHIAHSLRTFKHFFDKYGFRSLLINERMDFHPDFADFRNFSGMYNKHTDSPPKKNTETDGRRRWH